MDMGVNERRRDNATLDIDNLASLGEMSDGDDVAGVDRDVCLDQLFREDVEDLSADQDKLGGVVALRDGATSISTCCVAPGPE
jgi:hypothetical protein